MTPRVPEHDGHGDVHPGWAASWPHPEGSTGRSPQTGDPGVRAWMPWTWRSLWRHGGLGALVVVAGCAWVLATLWFVANGAPSAGGEPPRLVVIQPSPTPTPRPPLVPVGVFATPNPASGVR